MRLKSLPPELVRAQEQIEGYARQFGLTFFRTVFEMVDYDQMNALAAYGHGCLWIGESPKTVRDQTTLHPC